MRSIVYAWKNPRLCKRVSQISFSQSWPIITSFTRLQKCYGMGKAGYPDSFYGYSVYALYEEKVLQYIYLWLLLRSVSIYEYQSLEFKLQLASYASVVEAKWLTSAANQRNVTSCNQRISVGKVMLQSTTFHCSVVVLIYFLLSVTRSIQHSYKSH